MPLEPSVAAIQEALIVLIAGATPSIAISEVEDKELELPNVGKSNTASLPCTSLIVPPFKVSAVIDAYSKEFV